MPRYRTTPDRAGWALALGGASVGIGMALTAWGGGTTAPLSLVGLWLIGTAAGVAGIAGIAAPVWWLLRARGPWAARRWWC